MPPVYSDEEPSDTEVQPVKKATGRARKSTNYEEVTPDDDDAGSADEKNGDAGADDEGGDEDEEVYVVEKIMSHMIDPNGVPLFEVKWEGYEKKSDRTWEPEENLIENASEVLNEYLDSIGGREKLYKEAANVLKTKKRGRPPSSTPQATNKRSRRNGEHPADSEPPASAKAALWKPPAGSWEDHIAHIDVCEDEDKNALQVYLTWKNGQKTVHSTEVCKQRCPRRMCDYFLQHVRIVKKDPDGSPS
ncbi:hypothetical protein VTJ49DRAFT_577 [Mycothermus thermophilus]|uniref:Chromo domain-containing protein n=1 Tax=Humicola insolens TaxID=85995 RepID=A0ABR3VEN5_HUMIN